MINNLIFCFNSTIPIFMLMIFGYLFKRAGFFSDEFIKQMNSFVFKAALPVLVFQDLSSENFYEVWDTRFVLFCFLVTLLSIALSVGCSFLLKEKTLQGEFSQVAFRSSAAILGIGFIQNIYGTSGMCPLMIIGTVPLYNIMSVILLSFFHPTERKLNRELVLKILKDIATNPIILGILVGLLWSVLRIPQPVIMSKTLRYLANLATPLGLMALGATFDFKKALGQKGPAVTACLMKLVLFCALFLPLAVQMGFREDKLVSILVMLGSPTTVSCFIMAKNMGHDGTLTSSVVMLTTFFSAFTLTLWLFILKTFGLV